MRLLVLLALLASPAYAQNLSADPDFVGACHAYAEQGAQSPACLGGAATDCQLLAGGDTTLGMETCLSSESETWDAILNDEYSTTRAALRARDASEGTTLAPSLLTAQRAWLAYRDAECGLTYATYEGGSFSSVAYANCIMVLTANRALALRDMRAP